MRITERWKNVKKLERSIDDAGNITYTGERIWDVDGVDSEIAAIDAVPEAALKAGHNQTSMMTVSSHYGVEESKGLWAVHANYTTPSGQGGEEPPPKELDGPVFRWEEGNETFSTPTDTFGNPLVNSALDPFEGGRQEDVPTGYYTVILDQPFFDARQAAEYRGRVFDDELVTPWGTFQKLESRCISIAPVGDFTKGMLSQKVAYRIEVRFKENWPDMPPEMSPFDWSAVDQGEHAWADDGKPWNIVAAGDLTTQRSARLNGDGTPFDSNEAVLERKKTAKGIGAPQGATVQDRKSCKLLYYFARKRTQVAGLNLPTRP